MTSLRDEPLAPLTRTEAAARYSPPSEATRSIVTGSDQLIDHRMAHFPEVIDASITNAEQYT